MEQRMEQIKADNRKAKGRFLLVMLVCGLLGGVLGFSGAVLGTEKLTGLLAAAGHWFCREVAHWGALACLPLMLACFLLPYRKAKQMLDGWDGEDEALSERVEELLSKALWANNTLTIVLFFLAGASYVGVFGEGPVWGYLVGTAALIAGIVLTTAAQKRLVDLNRLLAPEKEGSVYDLNFQKKWLDSCDEAEKNLIGQCSYRAFQLTQKLCAVLWGVFILSGMFLDTGVLPTLAVCIIWGLSQWEYCRWSLKLSRPGAAEGNVA